MKIIDFTQSEDYHVTMSLRLERPEWEPRLKQAALELQRQGAVQGFRPGKAPLRMVESRYGKQLYQAAAQLAQNDMLLQACEEKALAPVSEPVVMAVQADGEALELAVNFWTYPELRELKYRGLRVERPVRVVSEADIDREAEHFRRNHLLVRPVQRGVQKGDIVELAFRAETEGFSFSYDRSDHARVLVGEGRLFAGLDEALLGHVAGDELDLDLAMPKDFHRDDIAGLTVHVHVRIKSVEERAEQELSDELVRRYVRDCEGVAAFRERLRFSLTAAYARRAEELYRRNLEHALADAVTAPLPESMYRTNLDRYLSGLAAAAKSQGQSVEELLTAEGKTLEQYLREVGPLAREQVKLSVAYDYIVSQEDLTVSEEELQRFLTLRAQAQDISVEDALAQMGGRERAAEELQRQKIMKLLADSAETVDVELERLPGEDPAVPVLMPPY